MSGRAGERRVAASAEAHGHAMTNSHLLVQSFDYHEPTAIEEAVALLAEEPGRAAVLAGGTWLLVQLKMERPILPGAGSATPETLVNIQGLPGLTGVATSGRGLVIGPLTTIWELHSALVGDGSGRWWGGAALPDACAAFGSTQIQMTGTLGGNICNGSPASDTVPALTVLGAKLLLVGPDGEREVPIETFLVGPGQTSLGPGELLKAIRIPETTHGAGSAFIKLSRVRADLAKASAAAMVVRDRGRIVDCRMAFGAVSPTVVRCRTAEEMVTGEAYSPELALAAGEAASREVSPIDDIRSSAGYRRRVVQALAHDALRAAWRRAGAASDPDRRLAPGEGRGGMRRQAGVEEARQTAAQGRVNQASRPVHLSAREERAITLTVNGDERLLRVRPNELLINVLRDRLSLTGTKYGCGIGECGACTVHLDGVPTLSCLTLAVAADGRQVTTVEGLAGRYGGLDPLQEAFIDHDAFQCGYCTPGMLMMGKRLLADKTDPSERDVRDYLKGNRCRCTGFAAIVRAVTSYNDDEATGGER